MRRSAPDRPDPADPRARRQRPEYRVRPRHGHRRESRRALDRRPSRQRRSATSRMVSAQPTSTATRSLYQPHAGHTVCGSLAAEHRGHTLRDGADSFHAPARWLRDLDFDFFFLGTATGVFLDETSYERLAGRAAVASTARADSP